MDEQKLVQSIVEKAKSNLAEQQQIQQIPDHPLNGSQ